MNAHPATPAPADPPSVPQAAAIARRGRRGSKRGPSDERRDETALVGGRETLAATAGTPSDLTALPTQPVAVAAELVLRQLAVILRRRG